MLVRVCQAAAAALAAVTLAGCAAASGSTAARENCGTARTAAGIPVQIVVAAGQVACAAALQVETAYAQAIVAGKAPGNGGGGPVRVSGWTCEGMDTPELLKTGETSRCVQDGRQIIALLPAPPSPSPASG